jgi:hypothetical protein
MIINKLLFILSLIFVFASCNEIIEPDVSEVKVRVFTPRDSLISNSNIQSFFWETSLESVPCRIQIVKPNFDQIDYFIEDTLVSSNRFEITLPSAIYSWRIRAENNNSNGEYQYFHLTVDSSANLTDLTIQISHPYKNQFLTNQSSFTINWNSLLAAQQFEYIITNTTKSTEIQNITPLLSAPIDLGEGYYLAKIRGQGTFTNTAYSEVNFAIDTSAPQIPTNVFPTNNQILNSTQVVLNWSAPSNEISPEFDSVYFYLDVNGNSLLSKRRVSSSSLDTNLTNGVYYWSVRRFDQVGLQSENENPKRFFIQ